MGIQTKSISKTKIPVTSQHILKELLGCTTPLTCGRLNRWPNFVAERIMELFLTTLAGRFPLVVFLVFVETLDTVDTFDFTVRSLKFSRFLVGDSNVSKRFSTTQSPMN